jgi:hypothetical protein
MATARPAGRATFAPTEEQRAFVTAARAVGLAPALICRLLPRGAKGARDALTPASLARHFAEELRHDAMLAARLVVLRVLHRALTGDDRDAASAQLALFKTLPDWLQLGETEPAAAQRLDFDRLSRAERRALRTLIEKAVESDPDV